MDNKCPICNSEVQKPKPLLTNDQHLENYTCLRCGSYYLNSYMESYIPHLLQNDNSKIAILSHWIRTEYEANRPDDRGRTKMIILNKDLVESIIKNPPPNPTEKANNIIRWLGEHLHEHGKVIPLKPMQHQSIMGALTPNEFMWIIKFLIDTGVLEGTLTLDPQANVTLTFEGWKYYEELKKGATDSRKAFMAMKYGDEQMDKIVDEILKPAVEETGFDLLKLVDRPKAGLIDDRLRVEIQTSRFLIADLTHENAGAYWEAGYAEGLGKPVIYTCEKGKFEEQKTHFDTNHHLTVVWDANDPSEAAEELKATIRATLPGEARLTDE